MAILPLYDRAVIENKILFHNYDDITLPGIYDIAKAVVYEDRLGQFNTDVQAGS